MAKQKYAQHVLDNIRWFAKRRHDFSFDGASNYFLKKVNFYRYVVKEGKESAVWINRMSHASFCSAFDWNPKLNYLPEWEFTTQQYGYILDAEVEDCIQYDVNGVDAVEAFIQIDSYGTVKPTRHPALLKVLLKTKASLNLHIQMYAEDRANGILPKFLFEEEIIKPFEFKQWMIDAVENQKWNYIKTNNDSERLRILVPGIPGDSQTRNNNKRTGDCNTESPEYGLYNRDRSKLWWSRNSRAIKYRPYWNRVTSNSKNYNRPYRERYS